LYSTIKRDLNIYTLPQGRIQDFFKGEGGCKEEKTAICYYFCDEKAIDAGNQTSSETSQGGGATLSTLPLDPLLPYPHFKIIT